MKKISIKLVKIQLESEEENRQFDEGFGDMFFVFQDYNVEAHHSISYENIKDNHFLQSKINTRLGLISSEWDIIKVYPFCK